MQGSHHDSQITILVSLSVTVAMYCLIQLYVPVSKDLAQHKPLLKLFSVKAVGELLHVGNVIYVNANCLRSLPHLLASNFFIGPQHVWCSQGRECRKCLTTDVNLIF